MAAPLRTVPGTNGDPLAEAIELTRRLKLPHIRRSLTDMSATAQNGFWITFRADLTTRHQQ
ncbi:hypothetical protein [Kitasatospora sp. NPDC001132]